MDDAELPACVLEDWQAEMLSRLGRIEAQVKQTNGRVTGLEGRMQVADHERASLTAQVELIRSDGLDAIKRVVEEVFDDRQTASKAAAFDALEKQFGKNLESDLGKWSALTRLFSSTMSKAWLTAATLAAGAGAAAILERMF